MKKKQNKGLWLIYLKKFIYIFYNIANVNLNSIASDNQKA